MDNHSKPFQRNQGSEGQKPYRSPYKGEGYGLGTSVPEGAVELPTPPAPQPLLADARRGSGAEHAPEPTPLEALASRKPVAIPLDHEQSEILAEMGHCFAVVGRTSYPGNPKRFTLHLVPTSIELADLAVRVARGQLATRKTSKA